MIPGLKNLINEVLGIVVLIDQMSDDMAKQFLQYLIDLENGRIESESNIFTYKTGDWIKAKIPIYQIFIRYQTNDKFQPNKVSGSYVPKETVETVDKKWSIVLNLILSSQYNEEVEKNLSSFFAHEMQHFFDFYKRKNKVSRTRLYNRSVNYLNTNFNFSFNPPLKSFINSFYYAMSEERNARVQQIYNEMKFYENMDYGQLIGKFEETAIYKEIRILRNFNADDIIQNIPIETQQSFIEFFEESMKKFQNNPKYPKEPSLFFRHWEKYFHEAGNDLFRKCLRVIGSLKNIQESNDWTDYLIHLDGTTMGILIEDLNLYQKDGIWL